MTLTRPDRFDIPGLSPERKDKLESAFEWLFGPNVPGDVVDACLDGYRSVMHAIPKPITPETEQSNG